MTLPDSQAGTSGHRLIEKLMRSKIVLEIDGSRFSTLQEFFDEVSQALVPGVDWGHNLDAFNDILRGGFGTPEGGFVLRWNHADLSRKYLGHAETLRQLRIRLAHCHADCRGSLEREITQAESHTGPTAFDWLVDIIRAHGVGGTEAQDGVELELLPHG